MKTVDLSKVLDMLINEEQSEASGLLHEWFVEKSKQIHEELMQEGTSLSKDIEDDQDAIKAEEFYSEEEDEDDSDTDAVDADADSDFDADADVAADDDLDVDGGDMDAGAEAPAEVTIADTIEDLEAVMARLKAEFAEITGVGVDTDDETVGGDADSDVGEPAEFGGDEADADAGEPVDAEESFTFESEETDEDAEEVTESEDDFADLEESWVLEPVKDPNLNGGKEVGADGAKVSVNDKSPLPEHDADARVGGNAVEIHAEEHQGFERETAPDVKAKPLLKNQVKKSTDGRTKVSKEGDKSAKLNSKDGFGSDSPKSPIGQATDLRGNDFKRK